MPKPTILILLISSFGWANAEVFRIDSVIDFDNVAEFVDPGDTIIWEDGDYVDVGVEGKFSGLPGAPIRILAETPGKVRFSGISYHRLKGDYIHIEGLVFDHDNRTLTWNPTHPSADALIEMKGSHSSVRNCEFRAYDRTDILPDTLPFYYVRISGRGNLIEYCDLGPKRMSGNLINVEMEVEGDGSHRIRNNYLHDFTSPGAFPADLDTEALRIGNQNSQLLASNTLVE
ncbi:MAG: chondroitinase-B domain-containing protein, partial [Verrucomicrobiota bacterium]